MAQFYCHLYIKHEHKKIKEYLEEEKLPVGNPCFFSFFFSAALDIWMGGRLYFQTILSR
jgi:hypothetical protein